MFRKTFLLFSLLVCTCGEVFAHDANTTDTSFIYGERPDWFSKYCDSDSSHYDKTACIHHLTGIYWIKVWNDEYFKEDGETTITMFSFESGFREGHPENQLKEIKNIISGEVFQCIGSGCGYGVGRNFRKHFWDRSPGDIATIASGNAFTSGSIGSINNINGKQVVVVTGAGNYSHKTSTDTVVKATSKTWRVDGLKEKIIKQPFALIAGGMSVSYWLTNCKENPNHCGLFRAGKIPPSPDSEGWGASYVCGELGKEICILAPFSTVVGNGTSISTAYLGATVWAVAYFLKNKYKWVEPMTQLQAAVTAVAIIKSCAKDIGPEGPDYENGLGALSLYCLYDNLDWFEDKPLSEIKFIANPLSVIKKEFYLVPNEEYVKPQLNLCHTPEVDDDGDGLIEICYIEDLDAVRYQLDGSAYQAGPMATMSTLGCPSSGCRGYELVRDLDFAAETSYRDAANRLSYTEGTGWLPIGDANTPFSGIFAGNNHRVSHLRIQRSGVDGAWGLFAETSDAAHIDGLALTSLTIDIASHGRTDRINELLVGALVAHNRGVITNSSAHGNITVRSYFDGISDRVETGGLVARNATSSARIANCYATVRSETIILGSARFWHQLGGLVATNRGTIRNSYAIADLSVRDGVNNIAANRATIGGLVAMNEGKLRDSYALVLIDENNVDPAFLRRGGLVAEQITGTITSSYWDAEFSGITSGAGTSQTSVALQSPIAAQSDDAMQAYYLWDSANWDFGSSSQYPILKYNDERCATEQAPSYCGHSLAAQGSLLRNLVVSSGSGLSGRFSPLSAEHTIAVNAERNAVELRPSAFATDAVLSVQRGAQRLAESASGDSVTIAIEQAQTTVTFTVRSANRQSRDYHFVIHRLDDVVDVDADDDGLIEISKLEDLNAVRYQPDGSGYRATTGSLKLTIGCPQSGCNGYELIDDLDFADAASYRDAANQALYYADADGWQPLEFWGAHFDGNGHTIANLKVQTTDRGGLFAYLGFGSRLSRVGLLDAEISGGDDSGALVGLANEESRIEHCYAMGRVTGRNRVGGLVGQPLGLVNHSRSSVAVTGITLVGGLAGEANLAARITDSHASGDVIGNGNAVGGLVGSSSAAIIDSYASGAVRGNRRVGGLVGSSSAAIIDSYASGAVTGDRNVGGLVGSSSAAIIDSYASGAVTGDRNVGGLVGSSGGSNNIISNSYASGAVRGNRRVGGLVGLFGSEIFSTIINSYAVGTVSGDTEVGGLVGTANALSGRRQYRIINCYALGELSGTTAIGGLLGMSRGSFNSEDLALSGFPVSITHSYWNTQTSGVTNSIGKIQAPEFPNQGGTGLSTVQMQSPLAPGTTSTAAYYNWSVEDWDFGSRTQYPAVRRSGSNALVVRQRASLAILTVQIEDRLVSLNTELMQHDIEVDFEIGQITVAATTATPAAMTVDGEPLSNGESRAIDLEVLQPRPIHVVLVPHCCTTATHSNLVDSVSTRTYIVTVVRQLSVDLSALGVSSGDLEPTFSPRHYDYMMRVPNRIAELTVIANAADSEGTTIELLADGGTTDTEIALVEGGTTTLTVIVRSTRTAEEQMYTIAVWRDPSGDATLRELHVSDSVLMPDFDPEISAYTVIVSSTNATVRVVATASNEHATIEINDQKVASGERSDAIAVAANATTTLRIKVTAQDGITKKTYTVAVWRDPSGDATLRELHVSDSGLTPDFDPEISTYTVIVSSTNTTVRVVATASNEHATIEINDQKVASGERSDAIAVAANATTTLRIKVTAQDGIAQETYTIAVSHSFPFIRIRSKLFLEVPLR